MQHRVLVVDDEPQITEVVKVFLESESYEVLTAASAEEALGLLKENKIDIVISDEAMPGMSGTTFLGIVRSEFPEIARILLTGLTDFDIAVNAINIGEIYRFFTKPCDFKELRATLKRAIQQRELAAKTRQLLATRPQQGGASRRSGKSHPGTTMIDKTQTGSIIIERDPTNFKGPAKEL